MSFSHEMPPADHEPFMYFREDLDDLFKKQADAVVIVQDPDNMILPAEYFLGGQLEINPDLFGSISIIRAGVGTGQLTSITLETDDYMMTDDKVFTALDPESSLNGYELDHLAWLLTNKHIEWSRRQSAEVARVYKEAGISIFAQRDKYLSGRPEKKQSRFAEVPKLVHSTSNMSSGESKPADPEMSEIEQYLTYEAIKTDTNGLSNDYESIQVIVPADEKAGRRAEVIIGGMVPSSPEFPDDYIDITLVNSMFDMRRVTTVVVQGTKFEISDQGVVTLTDIPHHRLIGHDLTVLSFMLRQRNPVAKYSRENTIRLADAWREARQAPPRD